MKHDFLVLGGTFDHLHAGHKRLIQEAFLLANHVVLGLTLPEMNRQKTFANLILPYKTRAQEIARYVRALGKFDKLEIIPIKDVFGSTLVDARLQALLVTKHTQVGASLVNRERVLRGQKPLVVHVAQLVIDQSGEILSSTRIRQGLVNRDGFYYPHVFTRDWLLTDATRARLGLPLGRVSKIFPKILARHENVILIGDVVTKTAMENGINFASAWIDGRSARKPFTISVPLPYVLKKVNLINPRGTIASGVATLMQSFLLAKNIVYLIGGEEDLLALVAIIYSPLGSRVVYGNPYGKTGVTVVTADELTKEEVRGLLANQS